MRHYRVKRCSLHFFQALDDVFDPRLWANYPQPALDQMDTADATGPDACCDTVTARVTLGH